MKIDRLRGPLSIIALLSLFFAQNAVAQTYCVSKGNAPWTEWIDNVQFGTINNTSQKEGYGNFTSQTTNIAKGVANTLRVTQGFSWAADPTNATQQGRAWIDLNQNGTFEDTEIVATFSRSNTTASVTIPATATIGATRIRISLKTIGLPTACETFDKGEVEDYTVNITGGTTATQPDLAITDIVRSPIMKLDEPFKISFRLKNLGGATPSNYFMSLFNISIKGNNPTDLFNNLKDVFRIDSIPSGFDSLITFNAYLPFYVTSGINTLKISTDEGNRVVESNETNNTFSFVYDVPPSTTDNTKLKVTSVTGATTGVPNGNLLVSVTIQNTSTIASAPDSLVFVGYSAVAFGVSRYNYYNYGQNRIAIPSIPAGGTITIPANFILPKELAALGTLLPSNKPTIAPYILTQSGLERFGRDFQFPVGSYFYPVKPSAQADIAVTGRVLTTYSRQDQTLNFELTIRNLGINKAKNVRVVLDSCFSRAGLNQFKDCLSNLNVVPPSVGRAEDLITLNGSLEEDRANHPIYYLDSIDVNQSITVTLRATLLPREFSGPGLKVVPDSFEIQPRLFAVDAVDNNATNNQTTLLKFLKSPNNELTMSNCPSNVVVTAAVGATTAIATFGQPTGVSTAVCAPFTGITVIQRTFPSSGQAFPIGVNKVIFDVVDGCNNLKTCAFNVTVNAQTNGLPDLIFNGYSEAFNYAGSALNWNYFSIKNNGSGTATAPFTLDAYLSTDSIFSANDVLLGKTTFNQSLLQGQAVDVPKGNFITPKNTPEGAYYVIYKLDGGNVVNEFLETNNTFFTTQNVYNPDMNVVAIFTTPTLLVGIPGTITRGDQVSLADNRTFWNSGGQRTDKFTTKFYFSRDTILSADDYVINTLLDSITPFVRVDFPFNTSLVPNTFTSGTYYLIYQLDVNNDIVESNENNNKNILTIIWNNGGTTFFPDLTLANLTVGVPSVQQGQNLNFNVDGKNIGAAPATGGFTIKSYLSTDQVLDASDYQNGTIPTANYAVGTNILQIGGAMNVSNAVAAGNYYLILKIDADNQITESNENNNVIVSTVQINVTAVTSTTYCASKGIAPWEYAIGNVQIGTTVNPSDKFKDFATLGYSDYSDLTFNLTKGQTYPLSITPLLSWIGNLPNTFARVWIDFNQNKTFEANELVLEQTNANPLTQNVLIPTTALTGATRMRVSLKNGAYPTACETFDKGEVEDYTINITGGGTPNLSITAVTGPTSATPGSQITLVVTVTNTGTAPTVPTKMQYRQNEYANGYTEPLTNDFLTIAPLAPNETRVINYTLTLINPIYPFNAQYFSGSRQFRQFNFGGNYVQATNGNSSTDQAPFYTEPKFAFNLPITFPSANISVNVVPSKTTLAVGETWSATYSVKNNSAILVKQVFVNLGAFAKFNLNQSLGSFSASFSGTAPPNSVVKLDGGETNRFGLEVFDLAPGETRSVTLDFSTPLTFDALPATTRLEFPMVNAFSNIVNTNTTAGSPITINYNVATSGTPKLMITNVTGPTTALPGSQITLAVTVTNTGTAPTVATKMFYRQKNFANFGTIALSDNFLTIAPLAINETRVVTFTLTLKNVIYPPNASYISSGFSPYNFSDYYVIASNETLLNGTPIPTLLDPNFKFNLTPTFPQANISVNVVPNKTTLRRGEKWNATYTVKNNSTTLVKQVFVNLGIFENLGRNFLSPNFQVDSVGVLPANSLLYTSGAEKWAYGLEALDLAAGESRWITLFFSNILTYFDQSQGGFPDSTATGTLQFPTINAASNVVNTNTTVGAPISIFVNPPKRLIINPIVKRFVF
jgi:subtilase family serine protease